MRGKAGSLRLGRRAVIGALGGLVCEPASPRAQPRGQLRLGIVLAGADPDADALVRHGAEIAAEILARRGRPLMLRFAEARSEEDGVQRATSKLVDDGADLLLASCGDLATGVALGVAERRGVPLIAAAATAPRLTDRGATLLVRTAPTTSQLLGRGLGLLRDLYAGAATPLPERIALVHVDDASGAIIRTTLAAVLPAAHLPLTAYTEIAVQRSGTLDQAQFAGMLATLREARPEVILVEAPPRTAAALVDAMATGGVRPAGIVAFGLAGLAAQEVFALPAGAGEGHVTFAPWPDPRSPVTAEVRSLFARRNPPTRFDVVQGGLGLTVDAVLLAGEAAARQPGARGQALAAALRTTVLSQKMMRGPPMRFDARGQNTALPSVALQNQAGRPRVVLPRDAAEAQPVWPNPVFVRT